MRRNSLAGLALLATPLTAGAAEMPPAPAAGAPLEERLYLASDTADDVVLLVARVTCVAYQRAMIGARLEAGLLARGWSGEADRLWRLSEALTAFEAAHIRPMVDRDSETALLAAYVPDPQPDGDDPRAARCGSFADAFMLRRVLG
jgi:hypothetical protein